MSNDDRRPASSSLIQRILHNALRLRVKGASGLVEEQNGRVRGDRACDGDTLLLATREQKAALSDGGVVALRQRHDEAVRIRPDARVLDGGHTVRVARVFEWCAGQAQLDVGADGHGEEDGLLRDEADLRTQPLNIEVLDVRAVELDGAAGRVVKALDEGNDGALPAARGTDECGRLARSEDEGYPLEDLDIRAGRVVEFDVVELNLADDLFGGEARRVEGVDGGDAVDGGEEFGSGTGGRGYGGDLWCKGRK